MTRLGWIGLGNMGAPMARNVAAAGHEVVAFDLCPEAREAAGVPTVDSALDAFRDADVVITMLPKGEHVRSALCGAGVLEATAAGALVIDCSTIAVADARSIAGEVQNRGRRFLDAPVSGGTAGAETGTLTFMVGGEPSDVEAARPLLDAMGSRVFHVGPAGSGQGVKMLNNLMLAVNLQGVAEAAALADRLGIDHSTLIECASVSSGDSWVLRNYYPIAGPVPSAPSNREFSGGFSVALMAKDLGLAHETAAGVDLDLAAARGMSERLQTLTDLGDAALDCSAVVKLV